MTVSVRVGEPIETAGFDLDDRDLLIDQVRQRISEMLAEEQSARTFESGSSTNQAPPGRDVSVQGFERLLVSSQDAILKVDLQRPKTFEGLRESEFELRGSLRCTVR